jgi:penicillin-binding protein 1A
LLKKVFITCLVLGVGSIGIGGITFAAMIKDSPELDPSKLVDPLPTKFYDKNGNFLYEYGKENRTKITYAQVPKKLEHAFIATEDAHFYEHQGIDIIGTARAIFENLTGHFGSQGGSTITQQKTTYLNGHPISNWDHQYHGMLSIRSALQWSYNIPALLTLREVGMDKA